MSEHRLRFVTVRYVMLRPVLFQSRYTEVVTETKRTVKREETPPPAEPTTGGGLRQLDALLHDLSETRFNTLGSHGKGGLRGEVTVQLSELTAAASCHHTNHLSLTDRLTEEQL